MEFHQWLSVQLSDERKKRSQNTDVKWSERVCERQMVDMRMILLCEEERKAKGVLSASLGLQARKAQSYKGNNREELSKEIGHF